MTTPPPAGWKAHLRNTFLTGIVAAVPLVVTAFVLWYIDQKTRALSQLLLHRDIPLVGLLIALGAIYALGFAVNSLLGRAVLYLLDGLLGRIPLFRELYQSWKHIALTPGGGEGMFAKVVLLADETGRLQMLGFTSGRPIEGAEDMCCVFVPAAPNPTSGRLYFVKRSDCRFLDISAEEGFKMILSGGNYVPALRSAPA